MLRASRCVSGLITGLVLASACKDSTGPRSLSVTLAVCSLPAAGESVFVIDLR